LKKRQSGWGFLVALPGQQVMLMLPAFRNQVHELEERKRKYKKALKKGRRGPKKATLWRTNSGYSTASAGVTSDEEGDDEVDGEEYVSVQRVSHLNLFPNLTVPSSLPQNARCSRAQYSSDQPTLPNSFSFLVNNAQTNCWAF
jgi:hypothetical protein